MKKYFYFASVIAAALSFGSCQKETISNGDDEAKVTFAIDVPTTVQTKDMSEADYADIVYYEIWNSDWTKKLYPSSGLASTEDIQVVDGKKQVILELTLVKGQTYNFIFWAQDKDFDGYDVTDLKAVKIDYSKFAGNQDSYDAFYAKKTIAVTASLKETVTLYRPFSQLNFGATKMATTLGNIDLGDTEITVSSLAQTFNTMTEKGEDMTTAPVTFKANDIATTEMLEVNSVNYTWIAMDYMLMEGIEQNVTVNASFEVEGLDLPVTHTIPNVPLKKNYRTNIIGDIFTADANLTIVIDPVFNKPDEVVKVGDVFEAADDAKLAELLVSAKDGDEIRLAAGNYSVAGSLPAGKDLKISGAGKDITTVNFTAAASANGSDVYFENLTLNKTNSNYNGFKHAKSEKYVNCKITSVLFLYGENVKFIDCDFEQTESAYNVWTYGAKTISFDGCDFHAAKGKALLIYQDGSNNDQVVDVKDCSFTADEIGYTWDSKAVTAMDIDSSAGTYVLNVENTTVTGFGTGAVSNSNVWNHKAGNNSVIVNIDGSEVYRF